MFNRITKKTNSRNSWQVTVDNLCYAFVKNVSDISIILEGNEINLSNKNDINKILINDKLLYIFDEFNNCKIYDIISGNYINLNLCDNEKLIVNQNFSKEYLYFQKEISLVNVSIGKIRTTDNDKKILNDFFPCFFSIDNVFGINENNFFCYNNNEQFLWKIDISILGTFFKLGHGEINIEVNRFLGVHKDKVVIELNDASFLILNIETGEFINRLALKYLDSNIEKNIIYNYTQLHNNVLVYYKDGCYMEYDLDKEVISNQFNIKDVLQTEKINDNAPNFIKEDNLLFYFVSGFGSFSNPALVVLNLLKQEVEWQFIYDNNDVMFIDIQKNDKNLFILDSERVLHIFEKE
ncbi:hypothetical protein [Flavobacterium columnare]|uniref:hypothetical protein n=1 Tax=Flavobacterium columnare TaxID=996 RepID=UPI003B9E452A